MLQRACGGSHPPAGFGAAEAGARWVATMIEPACADCVHWDSRDGLVGYCQEITGHFSLDAEVLVHGLAPCRTSARGRCRRFAPSDAAREQAEAEERHMREMRLSAGRDYPMSLN